MSKKPRTKTLVAHPTRWRPGQCGNPGGRPKGLTELRALAREHTQEAVETLVACMRDPDAPPVTRIAAAAHLLDRGFGKPTQHVEATIDRKIEIMSDDELLAIIHDGAAKEVTEH